jgi:general secretion pathway protein D
MSTHPAHPRFRALALATALALTFGPGGLMPFGVAMAATVKKAGPTVTLNFVNAEIEGVARAMAAIIDRQIMVDPRVKGQITLYSEQPLSPREAYLNFMSALRGQGFALIEVAGLLKVVPEADAKLQTGTVEVGNTTKRAGDQIITQIFKLQNENVNNMVTVLRPLISPNNTINAIPSSNSLVITDYADNLKRLGQIIAAMDVSSSTDMEAMPLQHAVATDMAQVVQKLADGGGTAAAGAGGATTLVMADARTNSLLVRAPNPARLAMIRGLVQRLDKPGANGAGGSNIHVVYLRNADAVKLAAILRASFATQGQGGAGGTAGATSAPAPTTPTASTTGGAAGSSSSAASTQSTTPVAASAQPSVGGFIQADPATNSLIITAPEALYRQLRAVIDQLDGRRAQVYIEAMIVEVNAEKLAEVGVQWQGLLGKEGDRNGLAVGTNLTGKNTRPLLTTSIGLATSTAAPTLGNGLNVGLIHDFGNNQYGLAALANFLQTKADGNILSTPNLVVLDNEEAKIVSGENVAFVTGQFTTTGANQNPFQTVERKDVGLTLRVKPQIGEGGTVRMTVFQEKSDVKAGTEDKANGPTTNKSALETSVVVDDGTLLILGGLIKENSGITQQKVPILGDLPYLGTLFRTESRSRTKTNLMVFLRPVVMRTQDAANRLTLDRYDYIRNEQSTVAVPPTWLMPVDVSQQLPSLKMSDGVALPSVRQPLDDPKAPQPTVVVPAGSPYLPKPAQP